MKVKTVAVAVGLVAVLAAGGLMLGNRIAGQRVAALADRGLKLEADGRTLTLAFATGEVEGGLSHLMSGLMGEMQNLGLELADFRTEESSLEDIFVDLVREPAA